MIYYTKHDGFKKIEKIKDIMIIKRKNNINFGIVVTFNIHENSCNINFQDFFLNKTAKEEILTKSDLELYDKDIKKIISELDLPN